MSKDEQAIEAEIQKKGLTAKRITPEMIDDEIAGQDFHVFPASCLTVCCLTLKNGYTVTGESACASPENFDKEIGRKIARANAREKIWPLLGFRLRDELMIVNKKGGQEHELIAATNNLLEQTYQMQGLFDDDDGSINRAIEDAEHAIEAMKA
jgi:hypothetical protein